MSYDLAVLEPRPELRDRSTFMLWYESRTTWRGGLDYSNASNAIPALRTWYQEMIAMFPPLGDPVHPSNVNNDLDWTTEYAIGTDIIYAAFRWNKAGVAYETTRRLAAKHAVGFFNASGDRGEVWFPSENGKLELIHEGTIDDKNRGTFAKQVADAQSRSDSVHCASMKDLVTQMREMDPTNPKAIIVDRTPPKTT
jgi:hypothetical protein